MLSIGIDSLYDKTEQLVKTVSVGNRKDQGKRSRKEQKVT